MAESFADHSPLLQAEGLVKVYGGRRVVDDLSLFVGRGEIVGLLGANGAGKTTAFYLLVGLVCPAAGQVLFEGRDITRLPIHARARLGIGYLAQEPSIFRHLTVEQNILSILENLGLKREERIRRLEELLEELHLTSLAKARAILLSGGERRRLEIARTLATQPSLLLLDEPFANIDPISIEEVKQMVHHLSGKGISIVITDHNAREIFSLVDRSYLIHEGKAIFSGSVDALLENEEARRSYLGTAFTL